MHIPRFTTINLPDALLEVRENSFDLAVRQLASPSLLSGFVVAGGVTLQLWSCQLDFTPAVRQRWQLWQAFIAKLKGQVVLFTVYNTAKVLPLGVGGGYAPGNPEHVITGTTITGTKIVTGATQLRVHEAQVRDRDAILVRGTPELAGARLFEPGDVFGVGGNMHMAIAAATFDANAIARVTFAAPLWKGVEKNQLIETRRPRCRMQLASPDGGRLSINAALHGSAGLEAIEVPFIE